MLIKFKYGAIRYVFGDENDNTFLKGLNKIQDGEFIYLPNFFKIRK
jgi:hypothetical protein